MFGFFLSTYAKMKPAVTAGHRAKKKTPPKGDNGKKGQQKSSLKRKRSDSHLNPTPKPKDPSTSKLEEYLFGDKETDHEVSSINPHRPAKMIGESESSVCLESSQKTNLSR